RFCGLQIALPLERREKYAPHSSHADALVRRHSWEQMPQQLATYSSPWCTERGHAVDYGTYSSLPFTERGHRTLAPNRYGSWKVASFEIDLLPHSESTSSPLTYRRFCGRVKIPCGKETKQRAIWPSTYALSSRAIQVLPISCSRIVMVAMSPSEPL